MTRILSILCLFAATSAFAEPYPPEARKAFVDNCSQGDAKMNAYCECMISGLEENYSAEELAAKGDKAGDELSGTTKFNQILDNCMKQM